MSVQQAADPNARSGLDEPLTDPTGDLLDMNQHARALAEYIRSNEKELPFTVGIFGEWGEGKTTMVHFLHHHLNKLREAESKPPIMFVEFSAWPFTTSEKLWRGLILAITKVLFDDNQKPKPVGADQVQTPDDQLKNRWINRLSRFLVSDFFPAKRPLTEYEQFLKDLEETDYGRVSKRTPSEQADQEAMVSAVVNGALTMLGTMSPLISGLRNLFSTGSNAQPVTSTATDETSIEAVEALPKFRRVFREMLVKKAGGEPVYVFIDDLDRAQPDVALDIMESIRIALSRVDCVFIIAVDETLISQGLQIRYKELFTEERKIALANKGQEYLEKIIQFRTRVPPRTAEQTKRLIAAEFPDWTPAGDIVQTITNNNPRRIKQYCQRLSFQKRVGSTFRLGSAGEETEPPELPAANNAPVVVTPSE